MRYKTWNAHTFLAAIAASLWLRRSFLYKKTYIVLSSWHKHKITHTPSTSNFLPKDHLKICEVASRFLCTSYEFLEVYNSPRKILTWLQGFLIDFLYLIYVSSNWWCVTTQLWVVPLIGWRKFPSTHDQSEALPRSQIPDLGSASDWLQHDMGMEFSCLFVRCHFARKPVVSSWNVSCFLKLAAPWVLQRIYNATPPLPGSHLTCFHQGIAPFPKQSGFPSLLVWCLCHILGSKVFDLMTSFVLMLSKMKE